jgi:hypothetical protein
MDTFVIEIPGNDEKALNDLNDFMDAWQESMVNYEKEVAKEFGISEWGATCVCYLRTRSRWTQEKEDYLIWLDKNGKELPNFNDDFDVPVDYSK